MVNRRCRQPNRSGSARLCRLLVPYGLPQRGRRAGLRGPWPRNAGRVLAAGSRMRRSMVPILGKVARGRLFGFPPAHLCLSQIKSEHIGGAARRELGDNKCARLVRRRARSAHLSPKINASLSRCDISCTTAVHDGGVARRTQQRGQGTPVGSNRSAVRHIRFAMGSAAMSGEMREAEEVDEPRRLGR